MAYQAKNVAPLCTSGVIGGYTAEAHQQANAHFLLFGNSALDTKDSFIIVLITN
jgi:hypothetical protein